MTALSALPAFPTPLAASAQRGAWRWVVGIVLLCVILQALLIPAQRIAERTHFHLSRSSVRVGAPPTPSQSVARAVFAHRVEAHDEALPHQHATLEAHDHGTRADVVYLSDQESPPPSPHAASSKRLLLDQDGLWAAVLPVLLIAVTRVLHVKSSSRVSTRNELPLERPPRA